MLIIVALIGCAKEKDPCEGKTCENGGTCFDGACNCPHPWTGENCTQQITPILITIGGVEITKLPPTDGNGAGWDLNNGPDIYVVVKQNTTVLLSTENNWVQNATIGAIWNQAFSINATLTPVIVELWDYDDFDPDDYMGGVTGYIYTNTNGFPEFVILDCPTCPVAARLGPCTYL